MARWLYHDHDVRHDVGKHPPVLTTTVGRRTTVNTKDHSISRATVNEVIHLMERRMRRIAQSRKDPELKAAWKIAAAKIGKLAGRAA